MRVNRPRIPTGANEQGFMGLDTFNNAYTPIYSLISKPDRIGRQVAQIVTGTYIPVFNVNNRSGVLKFAVTAAQNTTTFTTPTFGMRVRVDDKIIYEKEYQMPSVGGIREAGLMLGGSVGADSNREIAGITMSSIPWLAKLDIEAVNYDYPALQVVTAWHYHYTS